jgi:hypothetical protein
MRNSIISKYEPGALTTELAAEFSVTSRRYATPYAGTAKQAATPLALELAVLLYLVLETLERYIAMLKKLQKSHIIASLRRPTNRRTTPIV